MASFFRNMLGSSTTATTNDDAEALSSSSASAPLEGPVVTPFACRRVAPACSVAMPRAPPQPAPVVEDTTPKKVEKKKLRKRCKKVARRCSRIVRKPKPKACRVAPRRCKMVAPRRPRPTISSPVASSASSSSSVPSLPSASSSSSSASPPPQPVTSSRPRRKPRKTATVTRRPAPPPEPTIIDTAPRPVLRCLPPPRPQPVALTPPAPAPAPAPEPVRPRPQVRCRPAPRRLSPPPGPPAPPVPTPAPPLDHPPLRCLPARPVPVAPPQPPTQPAPVAPEPILIRPALDDIMVDCMIAPMPLMCSVRPSPTLDNPLFLDLFDGIPADTPDEEAGIKPAWVARLWHDDQQGTTPIAHPTAAQLGIPEVGGRALPLLHATPLPVSEDLDAAVITMLAEGANFRHTEHPGVSLTYIEQRLHAWPSLVPDAWPVDPAAPPVWPESVSAQLHDPENKTPCVPLSVDIVENATRLFLVMHAIDAAPELASAANVETALVRYERFLRLQYEHPEQILIPALDIMNCWLSHMIRTDRYKSDCGVLFQNAALGDSHRLFVDHDHLLFSLDYYGKLLTDDDDLVCAQATAMTQDLWQQTYGEPYVVNLADLYTDTTPATYDAQSTARTRPTPMSLAVEEIIHDRDWFADLRTSLGDEFALLEELSPCMFRALAVQYERFLYLNHAHAHAPMLSISVSGDLLWHAHQIFPSRYEMDCLRLFGARIPHIPWPASFHAQEHQQRVAELVQLYEQEFGSGEV